MHNGASYVSIGAVTIEVVVAAAARANAAVGNTSSRTYRKIDSCGMMMMMMMVIKMSSSQDGYSLKERRREEPHYSLDGSSSDAPWRFELV